MTLVILKFAVPEAAGQQPSAGALRWTPTKRRTAGDWVVMPAGFTVPLVNGEATVEVAPTGADWVWRVDEHVPTTQGGSRYVAVPDLAEIDYTDLIAVDPKTLEPSADPDPAWYAYVDTLEGQAATASASAVSAKNAAEAAQLSATGSETSAAASAATATDAATDAGTSAFNAGNSAAAALGHKNNAAESAGAAANSATAAADSATSANLSAVAAAGSELTATEMAELAQSSASDTVAAANGFTIGTVTTGTPGSPATATITGAAPNKKLNLGLPKGETGPANTLTVLDTVTGPETPGATGPQGVKGDKGDPGGITLGTVIDAQNLNDLKTAGVYRRTSTGTGLLALNYPADIDSGVLIVHVRLTDQTILQEFHTFNRASSGSRGYYRRTFSGSTWTSWQFVGTQRVDQTAGRAIYTWDHVNDREQLVYGDTGWRDINASLINGWTGTWCRIRRFGSEVTLTFLAMNSSVATADPFFTAPAGFKANTGGYHQGFWFTDTTVATGFLRLTGGGSLELIRRPATAYSASLQAVVKWTTDDAWPTTLPGTAVGSIPNL